MNDLISASDVQERAREFELVWVDYFCVHTAIDVQHRGQSPMEELQLAHRVCDKDRIPHTRGYQTCYITPDSYQQPRYCHRRWLYNQSN